jgi:hypothetical protein
LLRGRALDGFLTAEGASMLRAMLGRVAEGALTEFGDLALRSTPDRKTRRVHASACLDPAGGGYLIGLIGVSGKSTTPGA